MQQMARCLWILWALMAFMSGCIHAHDLEQQEDVILDAQEWQVDAMGSSSARQPASAVGANQPRRMASEQPAAAMEAEELDEGMQDALPSTHATSEPPNGNDDDEETLDVQTTLEELLSKVEDLFIELPRIEIDTETLQEMQRILAEQGEAIQRGDVKQLVDLFDQMAVDSGNTVDSEAAETNEAETEPTTEEDASDGNEATGDEKQPFREAEPSESFLAIDSRLVAEGYSPELTRDLMELVEADKDPYAAQKLAFIELFEPHGHRLLDERSDAVFDVHRAFRYLRVAADGGSMKALAVLTLMNLMDFGVARDKSMSYVERRGHAETLLQALADSQEHMTSLALAYARWQNLTSADINPSSNLLTMLQRQQLCSSAALLYHRGAEVTIQRIAEIGGEMKSELKRLSKELYEAKPATGVDEDATNQFEYYRQITQDPDHHQWAPATLNVAQMHFFGDEAAGVEQDYGQAAHHFRQAAEANEPLAQANYAMMALNGLGMKQDNATALEYFQRAAKQGNGFAFHGLGVMHLAGQGVERNETKAIEYFEQAVAHGYAESNSFLGSAYLHGKGVPRNQTRAFEHFQLASATKSSQSMFNLGVMHFQGYGTSVDCEKALHLFRHVALHPSTLNAVLPFSMAKADECYQEGDYLRAFVQYRLVGLFGVEVALVNAAHILEKHHPHLYGTSNEHATQQLLRMGTTQVPLAEALDLYKQAALLNDSEAIRKVGTCHEEGWENVCPRNASQALVYFEHAALEGDTEAAFKCGLMLSRGDEGIARDLLAAREYYGQCSEDEFPYNVPCALLLILLDAWLLTQRIVAFLLPLPSSAIGPF